MFSLNSYNKLTKFDMIDELSFNSFITSSIFKEAIYLASPEFFTIFERYINNDIKDSKKKQRIRNSILKYITRTCSRCTPFGLFTNCSVGSFSDKTEIQFETSKMYKRVTRLSMDVLDELCRNLLQNEEVKEKIKFYTNNSLYALSNQFRYISYEIQNGKRIYNLDGAVKTEYLEAIIEEAKKGKSIDELITLIVKDNITKTEAKEYISALVDCQILVPELGINLTGKNSLDHLIDILKLRHIDSNIINRLQQYQKSLLNLDENFSNTKIDYNLLIEQLKNKDSLSNHKSFFQTDVMATLQSNVLDKSIVHQLKKAMVILNKMSLPYEIERLANFKRIFKKRFESQEVALSYVLDTELGLGYDMAKDTITPLLDDLKLTQPKKLYKSIIWTEVDEILLKKVLFTLKNGSKIIELTHDDFKDFESKWDDLPDTISTVIEIVNLESGSQIFCNMIGGSSAANLISRFSHLDSSIDNHVSQILSLEESINQEKIIADIVHLPQSKAGNFIYRPTQRSYEIPYLGKSILSSKRQIDINDIMISMHGEEIILRSKKFNCQILPRLTNAHVPSSQSLPLYRFLCDIQLEKKREGVCFKWHSLFNSFSFLPRVTFQNIIFSKAKWIINILEIQHLYKLSNKDDVFKEFLDWGKTLELPKYVQLVEGDNTLLIHTHNSDCINMLLATVKNKKSFVLEEFLFHNTNLVTDNRDFFCNEFVVSFFNNKKLKDIEIKEN